MLAGPGLVGDESQCIYALGSNGSGQLGLGHTRDESTPQLVRRGHDISEGRLTAIVAGGNHTVILFDNGQTATTGENSDGRCLQAFERRIQTTEHCLSIADIGGITHVATTWSATLLVDKSGKLLVCGRGNSGELGLGEGTDHVESPTPIDHFPPPGTRVIKLVACMAHVIAVLSNGDVWGWGRGRRGQLGSPAAVVWRPRKIDGIKFNAVDAVCGKDFTCILGSPSTGELLVLGPTGHDRFGICSDAPSRLPSWKEAAASWGSIYILLHSGRVLSWGRNDHGQLPPPALPPLASIAAGSEHCLGITESGSALAWGWGEHGNCGEAAAPSGDAQPAWNDLNLPRRASAVFAGCATSFVVT